ncbi:MAG TPA: glycosyltransferase family 4 protein, partial [Chryseolinea sp.]
SRARSFLDSNDFEVYELPMQEIKKEIPSAILYFPVLLLNTIRFFSLVNRVKADLIVSNDLYNLIPALYRFLGGKVPYVVYVRFLPSKFPKPLVKFWCFWHVRFASHTIAVSKAVMDQLPYREKVTIIGGELPESHSEFRPSTSTRILYPANYIKGKGHEFALQSFSRISKKFPEWKLKFVGSDMGLKKNHDFKEKLEQLAKSLDLGTQVEWHTFAEKIDEEYKSAAIVLNFSESESFSLTCLEAMFYGRPVIATRSGGPAEIIDHEESGILVDVKDIAAMAEALDKLISNPEKRDRMSRIAYERVRQKFSHENTIAKLGLIYKAALKDY